MSRVEPKKTEVGTNLVELGTKLTELPLVIEGENKVSMANIEPLKKYIEELEAYKNEKLKNELDVEILEADLKNLKKVHSNFAIYRKGQLAPLKAIPTAFTTIENKDWKFILDDYEAEIEKRKEVLYLEADKNIKSVLDALMELESEAVKAQLDIRVFDKEFSSMRKTSYAQLTETGKIKKALSDKIEVLFNDAVQPIRDRVALEEKRVQEQKSFEMYLESFNSNSKNKEELSATIVGLEKFKLQVPELYPTIENMAKNSIDNRIDSCKNAIKAIESEEQRLQAEQAKKALQEADKEVLQKLSIIENGIDVIRNDKALLEEKIKELQGLWKDAKFADNRTKIEEVGKRLKDILSDVLIQEELSGELDDELATTLHLDEFVFNFSMKIKAKNEEEAIETARKIKEFALSLGAELKSI